MSDYEKISRAIEKVRFEISRLFEGNKPVEDLYSVGCEQKWDRSLLEVMREEDLIERFKTLNSSLRSLIYKKESVLRQDYLNSLLED